MPPRAAMEWTDDPEANRLIQRDPLALLIGFCLDQQIPVEKAFSGPLVIERRLGTLEAAALAAVDDGRWEQAFRTPPAIHRFPASMAARVHNLCRIVATEYGGDAAAIWRRVGDAPEVCRRLQALPGFGTAKARIVAAVLIRHFGVKLANADAVAPGGPCLADVVTADDRREYQRRKREAKRAARD